MTIEDFGQSLNIQQCSIDEYLEMEELAREKHEYYKGYMYPMERAGIYHEIFADPDALLHLESLFQFIKAKSL